MQPGANKDGYWAKDHAAVQLEDAIDLLPVMYPDHDVVFLFDQSSGHTKKRSDGLDAGGVNVEHGGKATSVRESALIDGCIGPFAGKMWRRHPAISWLEVLGPFVAV